MGMLLARYSSQQPAAYTFGVNAICMIICINMNHLPSAQVLLLRWMTTLTCKHGIAVCLMYRCNPRHTAGYNTMSFDKLYGDGMDFIGNKGFTRLAWNRDG